MADLVKQVYPEGVHESVPVQHVGDCYGFDCPFDISEHNDPNVTLKVERLVSLDGGATWLAGGGFTRPGGVHLVLPPDQFAELTAKFNFSDAKRAAQFGAAYDDALVSSGVPLAIAAWSERSYIPVFENRVSVDVKPTTKDPLMKLRISVIGGILAAGFALTGVSEKPAIPDLHQSIAVGANVSAFNGSTNNLTTGTVTTQATGSTGILTYSDGGGGSAPFSSFQDHYSNAWAGVSVANYDPFGGFMAGQESYQAALSGGAGHDFTINRSGAAKPVTISFVEITGATASPFDVSQRSAWGFSTNADTGATAPVGSSTKLAIGHLFSSNSGNTGTTSGGFSDIENAAAAKAMIVAQKTVATSDTPQMTATWGGADVGLGFVSAWKEAATPSNTASTVFSHQRVVADNRVQGKHVVRYG